jgi:hypothetical protein
MMAKGMIAKVEIGEEEARMRTAKRNRERILFFSSSH